MAIRDQKRLQRAFNYAKHSLELEGFKFDEQAEKNILAVLSGKMSRQDLINKYKVKGE